MKFNYARLITAAITLLFVSCEKVINVDLKDTDALVVVEGLVLDQTDGAPQTIFLSKSVPFSSDGKNLPVSGAVVRIEDTNDHYTELLTEAAPGVYEAHNVKGVEGHTYRLTAEVDNKTYTAISTMPFAVPFDSLYADSFAVFGDVVKQFVPVFQDPAGIRNYYGFKVHINDTTLNTFEGWDDRFSDGKKNSRPLNPGSDNLFYGDDTVDVLMYCIDKGVFDFLNSTYTATGDGQTPANPVTNISGKALGYFGAATLRKRQIVLK